MALPTTSGTGTARAVFDSRVVSFRRCAYNVALAARIVSSTKAAGPEIARHWKILLLDFPVAPLPVRRGDEFLWATRIAMFPFKALGLSCRTIGECHHV